MGNGMVSPIIMLLSWMIKIHCVCVLSFCVQTSNACIIRLHVVSHNWIKVHVLISVYAY